MFKSEGVSLKDNKVLDYARSNHAHLILLYAVTEGRVLNSALQHLSSEGMLVEVVGERVVWRGGVDYDAAMSLHTFKGAGRRVTEKLVEQLAADGFLPP